MSKKIPAGTWRNMKTSARAAGGRLRHAKSATAGAIAPTSRATGGKIIRVKVHKSLAGTFLAGKKEDPQAFGDEAAARYHAMTGANESLANRRDRARRHMQDLPVSKKTW